MKKRNEEMKKRLVLEEFKVLKEKNEYYRQKNMTAMFERLIMMRKYYKKHSPEAMAMEKKYIDKYGDEIGKSGTCTPLSLSGRGA